MRQLNFKFNTAISRDFNCIWLLNCQLGSTKVLLPLVTLISFRLSFSMWFEQLFQLTYCGLNKITAMMQTTTKLECLTSRRTIQNQSIKTQGNSCKYLILNSRRTIQNQSIKTQGNSCKHLIFNSRRTIQNQSIKTQGNSCKYLIFNSRRTIQNQSIKTQGNSCKHLIFNSRRTIQNQSIKTQGNTM